MRLLLVGRRPSPLLLELPLHRREALLCLQPLLTLHARALGRLHFPGRRVGRCSRGRLVARVLFLYSCIRAHPFDDSLLLVQLELRDKQGLLRPTRPARVVRAAGRAMACSKESGHKSALLNARRVHI